VQDESNQTPDRDSFGLLEEKVGPDTDFFLSENESQRSFVF
jgi:hypothetical protein